VTVEIFNRANYDSFGDSVKEVVIRFADEPKYYKFANLKELIDKEYATRQKLKRKEEELRKLQEENRLKEEAERIARQKANEEEQARLELERIDREKKEAAQKAEIELLRKAQEEKQQEINRQRSFLRTGIELRSQHILDEYQEDAKRAHLYDGIPIVIDGGPGTGKTTTTIQRLKFLLSKAALEEYDNPLTSSQIEYLMGQDWNTRWLFFSPTDLLREYLKNNMAQEDLKVTDDNTRTLDRFRLVKMRDYYRLFDPTKDGPFKTYKVKSAERLILKPIRAISDFEYYCIVFTHEAMKKRVDLETKDYSWHKIALRIKSMIKNAVTSDIGGLIRLLDSLRNSEHANIIEIDRQLKEIIDFESVKAKRVIMQDEEVVRQINSLFEQWRKEKIQIVEDDEDDMTTQEEDDENEEMNSFNKQDFEYKLFSTLRKLLRRIALKKIDSKTKLSKRDESFRALVADYLDDVDYGRIGELAWFTKNFSSMCRGIDSCLISQLPKIYKAYRKEVLQKQTDTYNLSLLEDIIKKDNNKNLHAEEQNLLLGFMNNLFFKIFKWSKSQFDGLKSPYVAAYKESVRLVIGIDEATDYSLLDYYFMVSFRHYEFSAITLCGDIMQGLNDNGIESWDDLKSFILPGLDVKHLNISYRQIPTLVDMAREMYKDDQGYYPSYTSEMEVSADEPKPLMLISDDEEEKAEWIANRILEIYHTYNTLPSVAVFVGDDVNIKEFINRIEDTGILDGIEVVDCSGGKKLESKEVIRVFRLSEVKGMEFEAVFFYDIDKAIEGHSDKIMRRHLYVGISRATSHLAATMTAESGNESIIKYFDTSAAEWS
jgi:hypothetical protein